MNTIIIDFKFGVQRWKSIDFETAAQMIENYVTIERKHCENFVKVLNADHWITSFWSEVLGGAKPPSYHHWIAPIATLRSARQAYSLGKTEDAVRNLNTAKVQYNRVHKYWMQYRNGISKGANRSIFAIELTITVLSSAAGAAMKTVKAGVALAGAIKAFDETAKQGGLIAIGAQRKLDFSKLTKEIAWAMVKSLIAGKLAEKFIKMIPFHTLSKTWKLDPQLAMKLIKPGMATKSQKFLVNFFTSVGNELLMDAVLKSAKKTIGKNVNMLSFMKLIAETVTINMSKSEIARVNFIMFATVNGWIK